MSWQGTRREFAGVVAAGLTGVAAFTPARATRQEEDSNPLQLIKPPALRPGDKVALINPAGATTQRVELQIIQESMAALGLEVKLPREPLRRYGYLAGSDEERAEEFNEQFADPSVKAVLAVRGGWGCARILPLIDFALVGRNPKILVGYSDVTALLLAVHARTGLVTFHGPVGLGPWNSFTVDYFRRVLFGGEPVLYRNPRDKGDYLTQVHDRVQTIRPGKATGRLLGGNLTVLAALMGSPYVPDWEGAVLFLEDVSENIYRIDRSLTQLKLAGVLDKINGFVFGKCTECGPGEGYGSLTLEQVFDDHILPLGIPAWHGAMIGHIANKFTLPEGIPAEIDATEGTIRLLEPAVQL
ncbi:MAG: LD-carboxypeptidase [Acidobacteriota bacterium]